MRSLSDRYVRSILLDGCSYADSGQKLELAETESVKKYLASVAIEDHTPARDVEEDFS